VTKKRTQEEEERRQLFVVPMVQLGYVSQMEFSLESKNIRPEGITNWLRHGRRPAPKFRHDAVILLSYIPEEDAKDAEKLLDAETELFPPHLWSKADRQRAEKKEKKNE